MRTSQTPLLGSAGAPPNVLGSTAFCLVLCNLRRKRERTEGMKPSFTQGVEANHFAEAINVDFSTPC
jgi:hypothetical protein